MAKTDLISMENGIKFTGFIGGICSLYFAIKSDLRDLQTNVRKDKEFTEYRLKELEDCCNGKNSNRMVMNLRHEAILPNGLEIESEK